VDEPSGSPTSPLRDNFGVVVRVPAGWTKEPPRATETELLALDAPTNYSNAPTRMAVLSLLGYFQSETPADVAKQYYGPAPPGGHPEFEARLVGDVTSCTVGADAAAYFQYSSQRSQITGAVTPGPYVGYMIIFLHFNYAYALRVEGTGGLDTQAVRDAKEVLGSWTWTITTPPSR
jgi:hypothetical protein